jgi:hypothetical protein
LVGRKCARLLTQKKVHKSSKTGTKNGCMIESEEELVEKAEGETEREREIDRMKEGEIWMVVVMGGWGWYKAEFAQNCCNATLAPRCYWPLQALDESSNLLTPRTACDHPPEKKEKKKGLCRVRKGTAQNTKPSYTGDKLPKPTPIEWTRLQFNDRKRAKAKKNPIFKTDLFILGQTREKHHKNEFKKCVSEA